MLLDLDVVGGEPLAAQVLLRSLWGNLAASVVPTLGVDTEAYGVLLYPGTDMRFPDENYGVMGPFASLRLKHWRRGIQDVDYLTIAAQIDPERTKQIVQEMIPVVLWEVGVTELEDPTYVYTDINWPTDPEVWETFRKELAHIIEGVSP